MNDEQSTIFHYSAMVDYYVCRWFIPFVSFNAFTAVDDGKNMGLTSEGYDVINFGSSRTQGTTQGMLDVGFRSRLARNLDLGLAYEKAVIESNGLSDDHFTFDLCIRF